MHTANSSRQPLPFGFGIFRHTMALAAIAAFAVACFLWWTGGPVHAGPHAIAASAAPIASNAGQGKAGNQRARTANKSKAGPGQSDQEEGEPLMVKGRPLRGQVNLNTATAEQLQMLPGIGESKAQRIVEDRQKRGKFQRVRDLRRVKGIGYQTLKKLTPYLSVQGETTLKLE